MTIRRFRPAASLAAMGLLAAGLTGIFTEPALAQQQATAEAPASTSASTVPANDRFLSLGEIERKATATGIRVSEIEVKDRIVEVEGRDSKNRKVELEVDRRSGEILSRKVED
jgi:type IV secretory pathway TrbL component